MRRIGPVNYLSLFAWLSVMSLLAEWCSSSPAKEVVGEREVVTVFPFWPSGIALSQKSSYRRRGHSSGCLKRNQPGCVHKMGNGPAFFSHAGEPPGFPTPPSTGH